jgi:glucokinase
VSAPPHAVVAVDAGGTMIKGALVTGDGRFVHELVRPTPVASGPDAVVATVQAVVAELLGAATSGAPGASAGAVAVVMPGVVDAASRTAVFSANFGLRNVPIGDLIASATSLPTLIEHDVRAAGIAERTVGVARGVDDYMLAVIGTGIAAAVYAGGRPVDGAHRLAGELGHVPVWPGGEPCPCGQRGCLERYASASAIARRFAALGGDPDATARDVASQCETDEAARRAWHEATEALAIAFVTCTMLLDPEMIVLAGGISEAGDALLGPVQAELAARITWRDPPPVRLSPLGGRAGLTGAAVLAWQLLARDGGAGPAAAGPHWDDWGRPVQR